MNTFLSTIYTNTNAPMATSFNIDHFSNTGAKIGVEYINVQNTDNKRSYSKVYKRVIFSRSNDKKPNNSELAMQCNGLIVDCSTKKIICMPATAFTEAKHSGMRDRLANMDASEFAIFPIYDGTILNLYWYNQRWSLGSSSGYDVSGFTSLADSTYESVFSSVCVQFGVSLDKLDKNKTHTFGFTHSSFHPYNISSKLWYIQSFDLKKFNSSSTVCYDDCVCYDAVGIDAEVAIAVEKVGDYKFGYMLRAKDSRKNVNVMVKTRLMEDIAQLIYDVPNRMLYNMYKRKYIAFRAFFSPIFSSMFIDLFPQYKEIYNILNNKLIDIANFIIKVEKSKCVKSYSTVGINRDSYAVDELYPIYEFLMENSNINSLDYLDSNIYLIIYDLIKSNRFLQYYLECL